MAGSDGTRYRSDLARERAAHRKTQAQLDDALKKITRLEEAAEEERERKDFQRNWHGLEYKG